MTALALLIVACIQVLINIKLHRGIEDIKYRFPCNRWFRGRQMLADTVLPSHQIQVLAEALTRDPATTIDCVALMERVETHHTTGAPDEQLSAALDEVFSRQVLR